MPECHFARDGEIRKKERKRERREKGKQEEREKR